MKVKLIPAFAVALGLAAISDIGAHEETAAAGASETNSLFQASFLANFDAANGKLTSLAEAFSDEQYDWQPAEGVRSTRESILHVAAANYFIASQLGASLPEGLDPRSFETSIHEKQEVLDTLKGSVEFVRSTIEELSEEELAKTINLFGTEMPYMSVALIVGGHANEHLGQLIAYARSMGVTPPWSQMQEG